MIFNKCLVIGEVYIIANFFIFFQKFEEKISRWSQVNNDQFSHQKLSKAELLKGCRLGIDSWDDTLCASKHAYVEEFIFGRTVNVTVFAPSLGSFKNNLLFVNILYAYDTPSGKTVLLEHNNVIWRVPSQYGMFALILWYVSKSLFR